MQTTVGKLLLQKAIPPDMWKEDVLFNKKGADAFFSELAEKHPEQYVDVLHQLNAVARVVATEHGRQTSLSLKDLTLPPELKVYREQIRRKLNGIAQNSKLTGKEKNEKLVGAMRDVLGEIQTKLENDTVKSGNVFGEMIKMGIKGNPVQLTQLLFGDLLVTDHRDRPIPIPILHGYGEGITPLEYWANTYGSRKAFADVQFATADTGFFGKQLALMAQKIRVVDADCKTENKGLLVDGDDPEIIGAVLAKGVGGLKAGHVIGKNDLVKLSGKRPWIHSLLTCDHAEGVCQKCAGQREKGKFPPIGAYIGIESARIIAEPLVQTALKSKHTGGAVGVTDEDLLGFEGINRFLQIPQHFRGGAVLAPKDGRVRQIVVAPQGGFYVHVDEQQVYIPEGRQLEVKKGQTVEAGDALTNGTPNPAEITKYKGLGEGRVYFLNKFQELLKDSGAPSHRRNLEVIARSFFDRVRITNPDGIAGHIINDIVPYSVLQQQYEAREDAEDRPVQRSINRFLEKPVLHYTIGTKITPSVVSKLKEAGVSNILTHQDDPGFVPEPLRLMELPSTDPDWKAQLSGFNLSRTFLSAAQKGTASSNKSTSYVPALMDPTRL